MTEKVKQFLKDRFHQEGTLIFIVIVSVLIGAFFFSHQQKQDNKFKVTGDNTKIIVNQQVHLTQGLYIRGATAITQDHRASAGVFKELTPRFEIEIGGGVQNRDESNSGFVELGFKVKI